jgi:hypothetical protein
MRVAFVAFDFFDGTIGGDDSAKQRTGLYALSALSRTLLIPLQYEQLAEKFWREKYNHLTPLRRVPVVLARRFRLFALSHHLGLLLGVAEIVRVHHTGAGGALHVPGLVGQPAFVALKTFVDSAFYSGGTQLTPLHLEVIQSTPSQGLRLHFLSACGLGSTASHSESFMISMPVLSLR